MTLTPETAARLESKRATLSGLIDRRAVIVAANQHSALITALAHAAAESCRHIHNATADSSTLPLNIGYLAWATRSLCECRIWIRLCSTPEGAEQFLATLFTDAEDVHEGFSKLVKTFMAQSDDAKRFKNLRTQLGALSAQLPNNLRGQRLRVSDVADQMGLGEDHQRIYKLLSKFTHITALSCFYQPGEQQTMDTIAAIILSGEAYLDEIIETLGNLEAQRDRPAQQGENT